MIPPRKMLEEEMERQDVKAILSKSLNELKYWKIAMDLKDFPHLLLALRKYLDVATIYEEEFL